MKNWLWVGYPLVVLALIIVSLKFGLSVSGKNWWLGLGKKKTEIETQQKQAAELSARLAVLNNIDKEMELETLKELLVAVPGNKQVAGMLGQIGRVAARSGAEIAKYGGKAGDVKEASESAVSSLGLDVSFRVSGFNVVKEILKSIEKELPLLRASGLKYSSGQLGLSIEQLWLPVAGGGAPAAAGLSDHDSIVTKVRQRLDEFEPLIVETDASDSGEIPNEENPF